MILIFAKLKKFTITLQFKLIPMKFNEESEIVIALGGKRHSLGVISYNFSQWITTGANILPEYNFTSDVFYPNEQKWRNLFPDIDCQLELTLLVYLDMLQQQAVMNQRVMVNQCSQLLSQLLKIQALINNRTLHFGAPQMDTFDLRSLLEVKKQYSMSISIVVFRYLRVIRNISILECLKFDSLI